MARKVMFSGGIPAADAEEVFTLLADTVGDRAESWPDGETTPGRRGWITGVNNNVLAPAPCFEPDQRILSQPQDHRYQHWKPLRIRPGAELDLRGRLPYAADAIASYAVFTRLREAGRIPERTRFQVSIPGAHDVISISFANSRDWPRLFVAWQEAVQEELRRILAVIPAEDLTVQLDFCTELIHIGGTWQRLIDWVPDAAAAELFDTYTSPKYLNGHLAGLPDEVRVGFHICCGTSPSYPVQALPDLTLPVDLANAIARATDGRVDYYHLPAMTDSDADYFAPLSCLEVGDADIYLGLECNDGLEAMERRIHAAGTVLPEFGVAHYCGYFWNGPVMRGLLETLAAGADVEAAVSRNHS
ncbi:MAG: hypothetical protein LKF98_05060 [Microbacteriaceae bacterium]|jgi:hypothetical protein|nr:hypothetical protein [Microbacteriaceae bacterium]